MGQAGKERQVAPHEPEPVRLVIWDLDETFWRGTLSEGGMRYDRAAHEIVLELARRGIVSSICSKNDFATVREILQREGIWEYFVFPSIDWEAKGPRLARLVEQMQLRPPTILFIDDNPMNRGEAQHYVPGIQTADEGIIPRLLESPLLRGKDDRQLTRLKQYQMLQHRQAEEAAFGSDNTEFLRASDLTVTIEHDLEPHLDRAIELINRTNQLNFTKERLPEDIGEARAALRALLGRYEVQGGILRVRDRYGDYGYCGLYVMVTGAGWKRLRHFCFSCRILNMGVESWLYQRLGRPKLRPQGEVLTDVIGDRRQIDWIRLDVAGAAEGAQSGVPSLDYFYARGGCDLHAVSHYFTLLVKNTFGEYNYVRDGANLRLDHSMFARYALTGLDATSRHALQAFGFQDQDFDSAIPRLPRDGAGIWLLSFWADADNALYRHRQTGVMAPLQLPGRVPTNMRNLIALSDAESGADPVFLRHLREEFEYVGRISEADFKANVRLVLERAPPAVPVFILQANDRVVQEGRKPVLSPGKRLLNGWVSEVAEEFANVHLLKVRDFIRDESEVITVSHFDRMVYFRIFQHISRCVAEWGGAAPAGRPAEAGAVPA
jgi:FkbH-like protein